MSAENPSVSKDSVNLHLCQPLNDHCLSSVNGKKGGEMVLAGAIQP